ncbi:MAG: Isocitrate dehydrogenase [NAD] subunit beta, mitochondrial [Marteilia pararefringens]
MRFIDSRLSALRFGLSKRFVEFDSTRFRSSSQTTVTLLPGDGTGPERVKCAVNVAKAADLPIIWEVYNISERNSFLDNNLEELIRSIRRNRLCLKGPLASVICERQQGMPNSSRIRTELDTFFNYLHFKPLGPSIPSHWPKLDVILIRESTEGEYCNAEHEVTNGVVQNLKIVTREKSERICREAFELAVRESRRKITLVHKANIMKLTDGLFIETAQNIKASSKIFEEIELETMIVDNCAMQLLSNPYKFDVMLTLNFYGNIISNILAGLVGSCGIVPGKLLGKNVRIYEAGLRKSFSEATGRNLSNPIGELLALTELAKDIGEINKASLIEKSIIEAISSDPKYRTPDIGGYAGTNEFMTNLLRIIARKRSEGQNNDNILKQ